MANFAIIIEHLDEDFFPWCQFGTKLLYMLNIRILFQEYRRIAEQICPSKLIITNFSHEIPQDWPASIKENIIIHEASIKDLDFPIHKICLMDSESPKLLEPSDCSQFSYFLLGGILGNGMIISPSYLVIFSRRI